MESPQKPVKKISIPQSLKEMAIAKQKYMIKLLEISGNDKNVYILLKKTNKIANRLIHVKLRTSRF